MIVVIQCAAGKEPNAGYLRQHRGGKPQGFLLTDEWTKSKVRRRP